MASFSKELCQQLIKYFTTKYDINLTSEQAEDFLSSLAGIGCKNSVGIVVRRLADWRTSSPPIMACSIVCLLFSSRSVDSSRQGGTHHQFALYKTKPA
jgi:hypothetical protein